MTPIAILVEVDGEDGVVTTPRDGTSGSYDPEARGDFTPGGPVKTNVRGQFQSREKAGLVGDLKGMFLISATALPSGLKTGQSRLLRTRSGESYTIMSTKERKYLGEIDGYELHLGA